MATGWVASLSSVLKASQTVELALAEQMNQHLFTYHPTGFWYCEAQSLLLHIVVISMYIERAEPTGMQTPPGAQAC